LQLRRDGTRDAQEEVVEPPVVEVVLDARATDPAHTTVDDDEFAMVDVPESVEVPPSRAGCRYGLDRGTQLNRADHPDVDARGKKPLVERAAPSVGIRPLAIDDDSDRDALGGLRNQKLCELDTDRPRPEPELIDVNRRRGRCDVREHRWIEVPTFDMNLRRRGDGLVEEEPEIALSGRRTKQQFGALALRDIHTLRLTPNTRVSLAHGE